MSLVGRANRQRTSYSRARIAVMQHSGGNQYLPCEARRGNNVVVLGLLVKCDQHGHGLAYMNIDGAVYVLDGMRAFHFYHFHVMSLYSEVD